MMHCLDSLLDKIEKKKERKNREKNTSILLVSMV